MATSDVRFGTHIKWYFTALFRAHMLDVTGDALDLWDLDSVKDNFDDIRNRINRDQNAAGVMPPSSLWGQTWDTRTRNRFLTDFDAWKANGHLP
jgi:hypothetical protein